jgi:hypothetical protein
MYKATREFMKARQAYTDLNLRVVDLKNIGG